MKFSIIREIRTTGSKSEGILSVNPNGIFAIEERLKIIKRAKNLYVQDLLNPYRWNAGMCFYIKKSLYENGENIDTYITIRRYIKEFFPENFNITQYEDIYWWRLSDNLSRLKAFNKLIRSYKHYLKNKQ